MSTRNRKLQVFVSSTYEDLKEERQAAVEAILRAGHIPAGMELFTAGDQSQWETIQRWIDESDVFLLILGARYGSIEPKSKKSYIQLEYEYASDKGKALFAVVITDEGIDRKLEELKRKAIEQDNPQKLKDFRRKVLSKLVRPWNDTKDIKLAVLETLPGFSLRDELIGWIPGNQAVDARLLAEEIAHLTKENASLRVQLSTIDTESYNGLTFEKMYQLLVAEKLETTTFTPEADKNIREIAQEFGHLKPNFLHLLWRWRDFLSRGATFLPDAPTLKLARFGLVDTEPRVEGFELRQKVEYVVLNDAGKRFLARLMVQRSENQNGGSSDDLDSS